MLEKPLSVFRARRRVLSALAVLGWLVLAACDDAGERAKHHQARGFALLANSQPEKAAVEFRNALQLNESLVDARFELAKLLERSGDLHAAVRNLRAVIEVDPAHALARIRLANAMLLAQAPEEAMQHAEVAVRAAPDLPEALIARSLAAYRMGQVPIALEDAQQVLVMDPWNADAGMLLAIERHDADDVQTALELIDDFIGANPDRIHLHQTKLGFLSAQDDHAAVGRQLQVMIDQFPSRDDIRQSLVAWHIKGQDFAAAERELRKLQELRPDDTGPVLARVRLAEKTKGVVAARAVLEREIAEALDPVALRLELARLDARNGNADVAISLLQTLIDQGPPPEIASPVHLLLAQFQGQSKDFDGVAANTSEVLEHDPGNAEALALRAVANLRRDRIEDALLDIRTALAEQPGNERYLRIAGEVFQYNGATALAQESYASAVRESGHAPEFVLAYGRFLLGTGEFRVYKAVLEEAWRKRPGEARIAADLAKLYLSSQNWEAAGHLAEEVAEYLPEVADRLFAAIAAGQSDYDAADALVFTLSAPGPNVAKRSAARVRALLQAGENVEAREIIDDALMKTPEDWSLVQLDAVLYEMENNPSQAESTYQKLLRTHPQEASGYAAYAAFLDRISSAERAVSVLQLGLRNATPESGLRLHLASLQLRAGNPQAAIEQFEELYARHPESLLAANNLASALAEYESDDPEQLRRAERIARRLAGSANPAFRDTYGWTKVLTGNAAAGLPDLEAASAALPGNPWVRFHAGIANLELGQTAQAKAHLQASLELIKDQPFPPRERILEIVAGLSN